MVSKITNCQLQQKTTPLSSIPEDVGTILDDRVASLALETDFSSIGKAAAEAATDTVVQVWIVQSKISCFNFVLDYLGALSGVRPLNRNESALKEIGLALDTACYIAEEIAPGPAMDVLDAASCATSFINKLSSYPDAIRSRKEKGYFLLFQKTVMLTTSAVKLAGKSIKMAAPYVASLDPLRPSIKVISRGLLHLNVGMFLFSLAQSQYAAAVQRAKKAEQAGA